MAQALDAILKEINTAYNPQRQTARSAYERDYSMTDQDMQAQQAGLEQARKDSFGDIETRANRRGMFYSGVPLGEQAKYLGSDFLPAQAALRSNFLTKKNSLYDRLTGILQGLDQTANERAYAEWNRQKAADEERRQFEAQLAAQREAAARSGGGGGSGGGAAFTPYSPVSAPVANQPQLTLRQQWQREANMGDWNAQVALNYAGDDGRYDGQVNSLSEYNILKKMGIKGNYYYAAAGGGGGGGGGGGF